MQFKFQILILPGTTGKDVIIALCGVFGDAVLNPAIEFTGSEETLNSLPVDSRLTISNMTTESGAIAGLFPIDNTLRKWLSYKATESSLFKNHGLSQENQRFTHSKIDSLFANKLEADKGATYAKELYLNLSTLSPYISGPNSVKIATPLHEVAAQNIPIQKAFLVSCTNSRASDLACAARVFRNAAQKNNGIVPKITEGVSLYIAAASKPEQEAAEAAGDWQVLLEAGA